MGPKGKHACYHFRNSVCPRGDSCKSKHTYSDNDPRFVAPKPLNPATLVPLKKPIHSKHLPRITSRILVDEYSNLCNFFASRSTNILKRRTLASHFWKDSHASRLGFEDLNAFLRQAELHNLVTLGQTRDTKELVVVLNVDAVGIVERISPGFVVVSHHDGSRLVIPHCDENLQDNSDESGDEDARNAKRELKERETKSMTKVIILQKEQNDSLILIPAYEILLGVFERNNTNMATREELQPLLYTSNSKLKRTCFSFRHFVRRAELHGIARRLVLTNNTYAKLLMEPDAANVLQT